MGYSRDCTMLGNCNKRVQCVLAIGTIMFIKIDDSTLDNKISVILACAPDHQHQGVAWSV